MYGECEIMSEEKTKTQRLVKATFEAVLNAQEQLRKQLDIFIKENRPIKDEKERELFFSLLAHSTLGLGLNQKFSIYAGNRYYSVGNIESAARWLAYETDSKIQSPKNYNEGDITPETPINIFWEELRNQLFTVFPEALNKSMSMSKEKSESPQTTGYIIEQS